MNELILALGPVLDTVPGVVQEVRPICDEEAVPDPAELLESIPPKERS